MVQARQSTPIRLFLGMKPLAVRMQDGRCHRTLPDYRHLSRSSTMIKPTTTATHQGPLTLLTATKEPTISEAAVLCAMIQESLQRPEPGPDTDQATLSATSSTGRNSSYPAAHHPARERRLMDKASPKGRNFQRLRRHFTAGVSLRNGCLDFHREPSYGR